MTTIDEVLAAMPEAAAEVAYEYLTIDPVTRRIIVPEAEGTFGVEGDGRSERKYFTCPRYVGDDLDLATCFLEVIYRNANEETDSYLVEDLVATADTVTFSWELTRKVTAYKGQFRVHADNGDGRDWGTTLATGTSLEGLEPEAVDVEAETSDQVTQLRAMVTAQTAAVEACGAAQVEAVETAAAESTADAKAQIEAKGEAVRASIPEAYTTLANTVDRLTHDRAAAIVCDAEGEAVQVTDASADPLQGLRIFGKTTQVKTTGAQLLDLRGRPAKQNLIGLTIDTADETLRIYGTATSSASVPLLGSMAGDTVLTTLTPGTYTLSYGRIYGLPPGYSASNGMEIKTGTFTLSGLFNVCAVVSEGFEVGVAVNKTVRIMLNAGSTSLPWEHYTGGQAAPSPEYPMELEHLPAPAVGVYGKNLITSFVDTTKLHNGVTFTVNSDGSITMDGTATEAALFNMVTLYETGPIIRPGAKYTISGATKVAAIQVYEWQDTWVQRASTSGETTFTLTENAKGVLIRYVVNPNLTADNLTVYPMLRLASDTDGTYEQGKTGQTLAVITPDSLPGIPVESGGNYTDADGQQWIADEVDLARGVYVQRIKTMQLPSTFVVNESTHEMWIQLPDSEAAGYNTAGLQCICTHFPGASRQEVYDRAFEEGYRGIAARDRFVRVIDNVAFNADPAALNAWIDEQTANGVAVAFSYILATPVEAPLTTEELQAFRALHSNKPATTVLNDAGAWMAVEYAADPKLYIDRKIAELVAANNT